jgi:hypothetical protein
VVAPTTVDLCRAFACIRDLVVASVSLRDCEDTNLKCKLACLQEGGDSFRRWSGRCRRWDAAQHLLRRSC